MLQVLTDGFGYVEDHSVTDIRLAICTVSCLFALGALIYDYLYPFPVSRPILITCVLSYPLKKNNSYRILVIGIIFMHERYCNS